MRSPREQVQDRLDLCFRNVAPTEQSKKNENRRSGQLETCGSSSSLRSARKINESSNHGNNKK